MIMKVTKTEAAVASLAPRGVLRAAINFGNPVLAHKDIATGVPRGVSVDLANELARRLGVSISYVTFDAAGKVFAAIGEDVWDVAFMAIDPQRATEVAFTAAYCIIEGTYMVRADSPFLTIGDADARGVRITVAKGSAYDLHLSRNLKHAEILRCSTGVEAMNLFVRDAYEIAAGVRGPLVRFAKTRPDLRVMDDRFMTIAQAMAIPRNRNEGSQYLCDFVEEMKRDGFVAGGLQASGELDALVAPAAGL
jgi:polar amino acid transport system substrate-binding protein